MMLVQGILKSLKTRAESLLPWTQPREMWAVCTRDIKKGEDLGPENLSTRLPNLSRGDFCRNHKLHLNGDFLCPKMEKDEYGMGDYYPGAYLKKGNVRFNFNLKQGDYLHVELK